MSQPCASLPEGRAVRRSCLDFCRCEPSAGTGHCHGDPNAGADHPGREDLWVLQWPTKERQDEKISRVGSQGCRRRSGVDWIGGGGGGPRHTTTPCGEGSDGGGEGQWRAAESRERWRWGRAVEGGGEREGEAGGETVAVESHRERRQAGGGGREQARGVRR
jgi:hypothetical protein